MSAKSRIILLAISLICILGAGCGGGNTPASLDATCRETALALNVWEDSFLGEPPVGSFELQTVQRDDEMVAQIKGVGTSGLKALYFDLTYGPARYLPLEAELTAALGDPKQLLTLAVLDQPGKVYFGAVLIHPDVQVGFSGDEVLAEVRFKRSEAGTTAPSVVREVSIAPTSDGSRAPLLWHPSNDTLDWYYYNQGDYDENGEVNISDLTSLGANFGVRCPQGTSAFPEILQLAAIDGDGNGEINIADITPIGMNFRSSALGGYEVYSSFDMNDYPSGNGEASIGDPIGTVDPPPGLSSTQRESFYFEVDNPQPGELFWVRPIDDEGNAGTPSNMVGGSPGVRATLSLDNPPSIGTGTETSHYIVYPGDVLNFSLEDSSLNDVTHSADTEYHISYGAPGVITTDTARLRVLSDFDGFFAVWAVYQDVQANNVIWFRTPIPTEQPVAVLTAPTTVGPRPLTVDFDASGSSDPDGTIVKYEFEWTGAYNGWTWFDSGGTAQQQFVYDTGMDFECWLRVTDNDGFYATTSIPIMVYEKSMTTAFQGDPATNVVGMYCSLAQVNYQPGISHYDETAGHLLYTYRIEPPLPDPPYWDTTVVDTEPLTGLWSSLIANGDYTLPYIAYYDETNQALKFARAMSLTPDGPTNWRIFTVDQGPDVGTRASIWQVNGYPMIAYEDAGNEAVKFAQATVQEPDSHQDWVIHTIASVNNADSSPCLSDMDGLPACLYWDTNKMMYACATTANPSSAADWEVMVAEDCFGVVGMHSLASVYHYLGGGIEAYSPAMSFYILSVGVYYLSSSPSPSGPEDFTRYLAALDGNINSMTCAWSKPVIAYRQSTDDSLWVARALTTEEEYLNNFATYPLDSLHTVGDYISIATIGQSFGVAYYDENNGNLCYASHSDLISP